MTGPATNRRSASPGSTTTRAPRGVPRTWCGVSSRRCMGPPPTESRATTTWERCRRGTCGRPWGCIPRFRDGASSSSGAHFSRTSLSRSATAGASSSMHRGRPRRRRLSKHSTSRAWLPTVTGAARRRPPSSSPTAAPGCPRPSRRQVHSSISTWDRRPTPRGGRDRRWNPLHSPPTERRSSAPQSPAARRRSCSARPPPWIPNRRLAHSR